MFQRLLWLSIAGACGTLSRYALCELSARHRLGHFPVGTFTVNILGSFLFGLVYILAQRKLNVTREMSVIILTGFMGAFTTFSTFAFDTAKMLNAAQWGLAAGNVFAQITCGIGALACGVIVGRAL